MDVVVSCKSQLTNNLRSAKRLLIKLIIVLWYSYKIEFISILFYVSIILQLQFILLRSFELLDGFLFFLSEIFTIAFLTFMDGEFRPRLLWAVV